MQKTDRNYMQKRIISGKFSGRHYVLVGDMDR
jgi:hypothetical protein